MGVTPASPSLPGYYDTQITRVSVHVSPDILLHPATYQCTGMYQHSGALLQRQRNELLSVPSVTYQKVNS
jgi:hypothetical protein